MEEKYKFTSKLTGKTVEIDILPDDIIVGGELRRIIRDENGQIPEWAKPKNNKQDYKRIALNGNIYNNKGRVFKSKGYLNTTHKGETVHISTLKIISNTFLKYKFKKGIGVRAVYRIPNGVTYNNFDITVLINDTKNTEIPEYFSFKSNITGDILQIKTIITDKIVNGELRRILGAKEEKYLIVENKSIKNDSIRITPDAKVYSYLGNLLNKPNTSIVSTYNIHFNRIRVCIDTFIGEVDSKYYQPKDLNNFDISLVINKHNEKFIKHIEKEDKVYQNIWSYIKYRCYTDLRCDRNRAYIGCTICDEWLADYHKFIDWYKSMEYKIFTKSKSSFNGLNVDKDLLIQCNKVYSPETVLLVPYYINLCIKRNNSLWDNTLEGVVKRDNRYYAQARKFGENKVVYLKCSEVLDEAHQAWVDFKNEQLQKVIIPYFINDVLPEYRNHPMVLKVIDALTNYKFN